MTTSMTGSTGFGMNTMTGKSNIPKGYKLGGFQQFTPEQMQLFKQTFGQVGPESFLGKLAGGDQGMFEQMEAPALRQFGEFQGNIASRFSGMGGGGRQLELGGRRSSGFQNTMSQAAQDFAQQLQSNRLGLQQQAIKQLMEMSNQLLGQRPYEQFMIKKQQRPSRFGQIMGAALPAVGAIGGALIPGAGPLGAALGGQLGSALASGFTGREATQPDWASISKLPTSWKT